MKAKSHEERIHTSVIVQHWGASRTCSMLPFFCDVLGQINDSAPAAVGPAMAVQDVKH